MSHLTLHPMPYPMSHLPAERLAALADESPTADEAAHLAGCGRCAAEVAAQQRLLSLAVAERHRPVEALTSWGALSAGLRRESLLPAAGVVPLPTGRGRRLLHAPALRAAAAVLLVLGGMMAGRASAGAPPLPLAAADRAQDASPGAFLTSVADEPAPAIASNTEALAVLVRAERDYKAAAAYLAAVDPSPAGAVEPAALRMRLAALDEVGAVTRAALDAAPHDPVINQYYLATLGARAATLRQLGLAAPGSLSGGF